MRRIRPLLPRRGRLRLLAIIASVLLATATFASLAMTTSAQIGNPAGPGQPVSMPPPQCPQTVTCTYDERVVAQAGYRFQSLTVCGENCTTQYWVSSLSDGRLLVDVAPVRGGGMIAVARDNEADGRPAIRTVLPNYGASDPDCCPSNYLDTTYNWDAARSGLVAGEVVTTPMQADDQVDWVDAHDMLMTDGFAEVFGGP